MQLTQNQETEVLRVYQKYFDSYMAGDIETVTGLLDDDYTQVGSAEGEVFFNKKDAVQFLYDTMDQVAGKVDMRNRVIKLERQENVFIIHEFADLYALVNGEWIFYAKFRASTFMQYKNDAWKIIHQHSSFPDVRAEVGQNIAADKIAEENQQLREAVKRRTIELEEKNRDLEIETSLERVRAVAMGMKQPADMLDVCRVITDQLLHLRIKDIRNVQTAIIDELKGTYQNFEYYKLHDKTIITEVDYHHHKMTTAFVSQMLAGPEEIFSQSLSGKDLRDWFEHQKTTNQFIDSYLETAPSLNYYWYSIGPVALGLSTYTPLSEAEITLLKRFRNVFELAYRRFMDIEKAEAQAREAQIELALERVRARTMAMQQSRELADTAAVLFQQIKELGFEMWSCGFCVWSTNDFVEAWMSADSGGLLPPMMIPYKQEPTHRKIYEASLNGPLVYEEVWEGKPLEMHYEFMQTIPSVKAAIDVLKNSGLSLPSKQCYYVGFFEQGYLLLITREPKAEASDLTLRFARVFAQTYTRFLDLQNAEAQAKESQIQLAMERVRARTMAMQKSDELRETSQLLFQQLTELGEPTEQLTIGIINEEENIVEISATFLGNKFQQTFRLNIDEPFVMKKVVKGWKTPLKSVSLELNGAELNGYNQFRNELVGSEMFLTNLAADVRRILYIGYFSKGFLSFATNEPRPLESLQLLERFASVFDSTYTRFLDLQKAEAQAKEAKIENALEKVRSRTMAMQRSEELPQAANNLFLQMQALGISAWSAGYCIWDEDRKAATAFMSSEGVIQKPFKLPTTVDPTSINIYEAYKRGDTFYVEELGGEALASHYKFMRTLPIVGEVLDGIINAGFPLPTFQIFHCAYFSHGYLLFITYEPVPVMWDVFKRFAKVFEQTYTRFLDLQKAEAQARESQIEAALERVRSKTMAMHRSSELLSVINVLSEQFLLLGFNIHSANFNTSYKEKDWNLWLYTPGYPLYPDQIHIPYFDHPYFNRTAANLAAGQDFSTEVFNKKDKDGFLDHLYENTIAKYGPIERKEFCYTMPGFAWSVVYLKNTAITIANYDAEPYSEEQNLILRRFGNVFEQSYTRFLDLQKAEAQAREAHIETALEKIRGRSLGMHHSDEIKDVVSILFEKLKELNLAFDGGAAIHLFTENSRNAVIWVASPDLLEPTCVYLPYDENAFENNTIIRDVWNAKETGEHIYNRCYSFEEKEIYFDYVFKHNDFITIPESSREFISQADSYTASFIAEKNSLLGANSWTGQLFSEQDFDVLKRIAKVFEQAYIRFLDLQKAEAQAREAQIELGLERVRARAMAMQKSEELKELIATVFSELTKLDLVLARCLIMIYDPVSKDSTWWMANSEAPTEPIGLCITYHEYPPYLAYINAWQERTLKWHYVLEGEDKKAWDDFLFTETELSLLPDFVISGMKEPARVYLNASFNSFGNLTLATLESLSDEQFDLLLRFAKVFDLTYTRFNDLQKAEAQARESQIQLALERVRARTMAMQKSDELSDTAFILFQQFRQLGEDPVQITIGIFNEEKKLIEFHVTGLDGDGSKVDESRNMDLNEPFLLNKLFIAWKEQSKSIIIKLAGDELVGWLKYRQTVAGDLGGSADFSSDQERFLGAAFFSKGLLSFSKEKSISDETMQILKRFAQVFEQTYTRFLDLQKAEAQAREAQIEAALERVRSGAMAMHKSEELKEVANEMRKQLRLLGQKELETCAIHLYDESPDYFQSWVALLSPKVQGEVIQTWFQFPKRGVKIIEKMLECYSQHKQDYILINEGANAQEFFEELRHRSSEVLEVVLKSLEGIAPDDYKVYWSLADFAGGALVMTTMIEPDENSRALLRKFANVFGLAYRRFTDLKNAEAQAREAQIEAALERVRGKAMAMHNSNDLSVTASMVFTELRKLVISPLRCGVGVLSNLSRRGQLYSATSSANGDSVALVGWVELSGHPVLERIYDTWVNNEDYYPELSGEQLKSYYESLLSGLQVPSFHWESGQKQYGTFLPFSIGCLYAWSEVPYNDTEIKILKRFAIIIDLTFRRYIELQKSEANAKGAIKQATLDRVRAEIASMRTIADLDRITPLIWNELTILGLPFIRCGVFIMDDTQQLIHTFLSTPDGNAIAAFHLPYNTAGKLANVLVHWRNNENYIDHWDETAFTDIAGILVKQGAIASPDQYLDTIPHGGFYLHFLPFLQGMLYVGNTAPLMEDEIGLIQSVADAFSTAYARYEDFTKLEAAKQLVEKSLVDLKLAQTLLIQSEKMASLGELTAGIAHEIQNPLNFVNNFSEVSNELIDEMIEEVAKGNFEEVKAIADDVKQNLEKINHHGKRADGIVKGMLQHSRTSSATKEPTDINKLVEEYLRLAYHGLRAKDKTFNATLKTEFDESIGNISIIPQDIGRVILNLITNAFYVVGEKKQQNSNGYEPTVSVGTKKISEKIEISVKDNGNGIPQKVFDKIFQPFFTTKPTGQGTGLGLSLAYDIVKAHGGELKVETKEGKGSEFIIYLPA